ncbi:MAG: NUDIX domain-containing protein [Ardenticatenaceae bacterium]|nr:NUDIX domain-containing protein [Ardenticatenaceae bacterium]
MKKFVANLVRFPLLRQLMLLGIRLFVPRQRLGVTMVALDERNRVLLLRHVFHPEYPWGLPGGWLGRNEPPDQGVLRELREETGLTAVLGPTLLVRREDHPPHIGIAYLGYVQPGAFSLSGEIIEAAWFDPDDLPPLYPFMDDAIQIALKRQQKSEA